jgi:hypothetical protein
MAVRIERADIRTSSVATTGCKKRGQTLKFGFLERSWFQEIRCMAVTRTEWNVIVIGAWNRAILTPAWIGKHLFELEEGTPLEVNVPLDEYRPYQVKHAGIIVVAASQNLLVKPVARDFGELARAAEIAARAVNELPRTPLVAAGINCAFKSDAAIERLTEVTTHRADNALADADFRISSRGIRRTLKWNEGAINLTVDDDEDEGWSIQFNFHLADKGEKRLSDWLKTPAADLEKAVSTILKKYLDVNIEETADAKTQ